MNVPWPAPFVGARAQGTASSQETWRFTLKQRLDAHASIQIITNADIGGGSRVSIQSFWFSVYSLAANNRLRGFATACGRAGETRIDWISGGGTKRTTFLHILPRPFRFSPRGVLEYPHGLPLQSLFDY